MGVQCTFKPEITLSLLPVVDRVLVPVEVFHLPRVVVGWQGRGWYICVGRNVRLWWDISFVRTSGLCISKETWRRLVKLRKRRANWCLMFCPSKKIGEWAEQRRWVSQGGSEADLSGEQGGGEEQEEQDGHLQQQQEEGGLSMGRKRRLEDDWRRGRGVVCCLLSRCIFPRPWRLHGSESILKGSLCNRPQETPY